MSDTQLERFAAEFGALICNGVGGRSRFALSHALDCASTDGIKGILIVEIPQKAGGNVDFSFRVEGEEIWDRLRGD